ncbi:MAG TPA: hypothetical protein VJ806_14360 [Luteimonas sp.]|nr:hypothetical protein [Luteimonas sp.]
MIFQLSPRIRRTETGVIRARGRRHGKQSFEAIIHRSRKGYALVLHHPNRIQPLLAENGAQLMRWRSLETALAFLTEKYGFPRAVRLNLGD